MKLYRCETTDFITGNRVFVIEDSANRSENGGDDNWNDYVDDWEARGWIVKLRTEEVWRAEHYSKENDMRLVLASWPRIV